MNNKPLRMVPLPALPSRPDLWRGSDLALAGAPGWSTGHAELDAQLPGGGWPAAGLVELLQPQPTQHAWRLLLPALALRLRPRALTQAAGPADQGPVLLVGSPEPGMLPFGPALAAQGLPLQRLLWVQAPESHARLWACEQALRCADVAIVLAWLGQVRAESLRRLHLCAVEHGKPLFIFRSAAARQQASAAPLRLLLEGDAEALRVWVLKRRGPPLAQPLQLPAQGRGLTALLSAGRQGRAAVLPQGLPPSGDHVHALDRAVAA